jgi:rhodanese-related sulfurtransferase
MKCKLFVSLVFMGFVLISCGQSNSNGAQPVTSSASNGETIPAATFKQAIASQSVQVLDVRTANEFNGGHISHALQANWMDKTEFADRTQHLDKNQPIYIYCQAGGRSASAQAFLIEKGYKVINLEGGMSNWKMNGFPVDGAGDKAQMRVEDFDKTIASNKVVLVDIGADWCPPCRKMLPVLETLKQKPAAPFYFLAVDGGDDIEVMKSLKSEGLPTFILFKNGKEIWRHQGLVTVEEFNAALIK